MKITYSNLLGEIIDDWVFEEEYGREYITQQRVTLEQGGFRPKEWLD